MLMWSCDHLLSRQFLVVLMGKVVHKIRILTITTKMMNKLMEGQTHSVVHLAIPAFSS